METSIAIAYQGSARPGRVPLLHGYWPNTPEGRERAMIELLNCRGDDREARADNDYHLVLVSNSTHQIIGRVTAG